MGPRKNFRFEKNQIITNTKFIVDTIMPLSIGLAGDNVYFILFKIIQSCTEEELFIHFPIEISNDGEKSFFDNHSLNLNNVLKNDKMKEFFKEETRNMNSNKIYMTDFVMRKDNKNKLYYTCGAYLSDNKNHVNKITLLLSRDSYIKLDLFINRLYILDPLAHSVFTNTDYTNIEFVNIDHIKCDACTTEVDSNIVCSHYTCGKGPCLFKFNYASIKKPGRKLRNFLAVNMYNLSYSKSFMISDLVYNQFDKELILLYKDMDKITDKLKSVKALVISEDLALKYTNMIDDEKMYYKEEK